MRMSPSSRVDSKGDGQVYSPAGNTDFTKNLSPASEHLVASATQSSLSLSCNKPKLDGSFESIEETYPSGTKVPLSDRMIVDSERSSPVAYSSGKFSALDEAEAEMSKALEVEKYRQIKMNFPSMVFANTSAPVQAHPAAKTSQISRESVFANFQNVLDSDEFKFKQSERERESMSCSAGNGDDKSNSSIDLNSQPSQGGLPALKVWLFFVGRL